MQVKLLRALQEKEVKRIGENVARKLDVRIIVATNRNFREEVQKGNFRQDLFYRLKGIELNRNVTGLSRSTIKCIMSHSWPGNVRELSMPLHLHCVVMNG